MPFMRIEVSGPELWIVVDGPFGTETISCDVCGVLPDYDDTVADCPDGVDPDDYYIHAAFEQVSDYTENRECWSIEELIGFAGRLSAPGYLDCTEWMGPFDSEGEGKECRD